jgi:hypothetical protein
LGHSSVICVFSFCLVAFSKNTLKLGLTLILQKVLYKNCDCQATRRKKYGAALKLARRTGINLQKKISCADFKMEKGGYWDDVDETHASFDEKNSS